MGVSWVLSSVTICSPFPLGFIHPQFESTGTFEQVQDGPGYSAAWDMAQTAIDHHARNPFVTYSTFPFLTHPLLAESRHNLVEIFVNDSNIRRTLQVGLGSPPWLQYTDTGCRMTF